MRNRSQEFDGTRPRVVLLRYLRRSMVLVHASFCSAFAAIRWCSSTCPFAPLSPQFDGARSRVLLLRYLHNTMVLVHASFDCAIADIQLYFVLSFNSGQRYIKQQTFKKSLQICGLIQIEIKLKNIKQYIRYKIKALKTTNNHKQTTSVCTK